MNPVLMTKTVKKVSLTKSGQEEKGGHVFPRMKRWVLLFYRTKESHEALQDNVHTLRLKTISEVRASKSIVIYSCPCIDFC